MFESSVSRSSRYCRYIRATSRAIAAKKAIVSAVSTTSRKLPPPGSSSKTSATSAMRPNFQAVCTTGRVSGLVDRARRGEGEHKRAQSHAIDHEDQCRVPRQVPEQPGDRGVADHEGNERRDRQRAQPRVGVLGSVQNRPELEQPAQNDGRDGEEEGEPCRARPVEAEEQAGGQR